MKKIALVSVVWFLASCGGGSGGGNPDSVGGSGVSGVSDVSGVSGVSDVSDVSLVTVTSNESVELYQDSFVRLNYPSDRTLNNEFDGTSAVFIAPEVSDLGGNPNCNISSSFLPGESLLILVDVALEEIFVENPQPDITFPTVNGTSMARISGFAGIGGQLVGVVAQYAYEDETVHQLLCIDLSEGDAEQLVNSVEIL